LDWEFGKLSKQAKKETKMHIVPMMDCGDGIARADNGSIGVILAVVTATKVLTAEETGLVITNRGSALDLTVTLPAPKAGLRYRFQKAVIDKDIIINTDVAATKIHGGAGATQGVTATSNTDTQYAACEVYCDGIAWWVANQLGTWAIS
jgi:hypothetical protein